MAMVVLGSKCVQSFTLLCVNHSYGVECVITVELLYSGHRWGTTLWPL